MVTREQALDVLTKLRENKPTKFFDKIDETSVGMNFILVFLSEYKNEVYASTIAEKMNISRSRVAVLIQKLMAKKMVEKSSSITDRRIEVLKITPLGLKEVNNFKEKALSNVTKVIEELGLDEVYRFIETSIKIKNALEDME